MGILRLFVNLANRVISKALEHFFFLDGGRSVNGSQYILPIRKLPARSHVRWMPLHVDKELGIPELELMPGHLRYLAFVDHEWREVAICSSKVD